MHVVNGRRFYFYLVVRGQTVAGRRLARMHVTVDVESIDNVVVAPAGTVDQ